MGMGSKGQMPMPPPPVIQKAPEQDDYLPPKSELPEIPQVTQAKLDEEKRERMRRLALTDTRESNIMNIGGALGDGTTENQEIKKAGLYVTPKTIGKSATKGLLSA